MIDCKKCTYEQFLSCFYKRHKRGLKQELAAVKHTLKHMIKYPIMVTEDHRIKTTWTVNAILEQIDELIHVNDQIIKWEIMGNGNK